ncbi:MAG: hypothetical protein UX09_C0016G0015 [Candidatus Uhrbacteria bacterium GW2011_GWE2_45_35]|uniref:Uncharacterized protein n=2 Tax=Candidatus Uhriibacteriota TaxID=1752732 RepID=A0A0G1LSA1_9BACT|nr:MAG: hypothetical protein UW63_C0009G0006 [Candidatus Uhrbacteria bacterium GW2011_GWF2_44_350]KKU08551.1 MAG: hypothetical protein UX09_C0016G0015 [Candidatus Uhrbacteria bacterium GW2011_GWE2_45_35]
MTENNHETIARREALKAEFQEIWQKYVEEKLLLVKKGLDGWVQLKFVKPEEVAPAMEKKRQELVAVTDFEKRVALYTNNFYGCWPGGLYRGGDPVYEAGLEDNPQARAARQYISEVVDKCIAECGYQDIAEAIGKKDPKISPETCAVALLEVFLAAAKEISIDDLRR